MVRLCWIIDQHAEDAQYHAPWYNKFHITPVRPSTVEPEEEVLRYLMTNMADNMTETWNTSELF